ncbi:MAG TPA: DUF2934 domain-containing protein [Chthoniobacterales bacterium]|nr:DUF2934 domain-containing protein [Chthoniobacterales bacterium]
MNFEDLFLFRPPLFLAPEHGGDTVSGGGHPADAPLPASEPIDDALAQDQRGYGNTPGVGVPGSKTNPAPPSQEEIARLGQGFWEKEGRPEGKAAEHWARAEQTLRERAGLG